MGGCGEPGATGLLPPARHPRPPPHHGDTFAAGCRRKGGAELCAPCPEAKDAAAQELASRRRSCPEQAHAGAKEGTRQAPLPVPGSRHPYRAPKGKAGFYPTSKLPPWCLAWPGTRCWQRTTPVAESQQHHCTNRVSGFCIVRPAPGIDSLCRQGKREEIWSETWFCLGFHHLWPGTCHVSQLPDDFRADHLFTGAHAFPKPSPFRAAPSSLGLLPSANVVHARAPEQNPSRRCN